jgi:hypothetical protein
MSTAPSLTDNAVRSVPWTLASYGGSKALTLATTAVLAHLLVPCRFRPDHAGRCSSSSWSASWEASGWAA